MTNRFKGLDLIDRAPEELWTEVHNIVQEVVIKTIPKEKKCKKAKWLSEEALQIAEKRREGKGKGEKKRYIHLNAEFRRIARRDKKAFLSDQCKEIEENIRMGKARDLLKKIRDTKGMMLLNCGVGEDSTHGHHQMVNAEIRLIIFFESKEEEALYSQQKQGQELTVAQILNSLLENSDLK